MTPTRVPSPQRGEGQGEGRALDISVIIPLAPGENTWRGLASDLKRVSHNFETLLVLPKGNKPNKNKLIALRSRFPQARILYAKRGRASQMNAGARAARGEYLWFLHADSRLAKKSINALMRSLELKPGCLHYFDLCFLNDGGSLMVVNTVGCWIRSHFLGLPFGDQGFCVSRRNFERVGGFPENLDCGEDHLFVRRAQQKGIRLNAVGATIKTSARKYKENGWLKTTLHHAWLWTTRAYPERR